MDFRILGPIEVRGDGGYPLDLGGRKQRVLLTALVLDANRVISTDRLIEALWGDSPPGTAATALHGYVSQLRKALAPEDRIVTRAPGYVLELEHDELDLGRFERLVEEGREALTAQDAAAAADRLCAALALWRGPALGELADERFARSEALRLEESRLAALEERIEADLALGRHAALIGELEAYVAEEPLRERPRAQLMLALYRSGRQAEALAAYRNARGALVDELGIEPGRELQELEQRILRHDPALELPAESRETRYAVEPVPAPKPQEFAEPREERKVVSVLFADLADFTARGDGLDPEDLRAILAPYHAVLRRELERFGATVEKFIGDAVMAVFGAPVAHEDDAERAVRAALSLLTAIRELNESRPDLGLAVRIGVNTGEAVVALGVRAASGETFVTGDVVNTASRLQELAPIGGVLVGEATHDATKDAVDYEQLEPVAAKGKKVPLHAWLVRGMRRAMTEPRPAVASPYVGREEELALLRQTWRRTARDGDVQLVTIVGEPGVGKSRLVAEFQSVVAGQDEGCIWRSGHCLPYGEGVTFWALSEIVKAHAGILESDGLEEAAAKLEAAVSAAVEEPSEREWLRGKLAPLVGLAGAEPGNRSESFAAWRRFVEALAEDQPLVLVFEDLHWADDPLLEFLEDLVDRSADVALLVVCTARPDLFERRSAWGGGKRNSTTIALSPLSHKETVRLIEALLQDTVLPADTEAALVERSGGNPLYTVEFVRMLTDRDGRDRRPSSISVPDTIQALIAGRLDTLSGERKALLQDAAVIGNVFWASALASISAREEREVEEELHELARREFVRRSRSSSVEGEHEYSFWHVLVRDVAYAQIPRAARARKHLAAARWIEALAEERSTDHAEFLAHHYANALELFRASGDSTRAQQLEKQAADALTLAGDRAFPLDVRSAEGYYRQALELITPGSPERTRLVANAAECAWLMAQYDEAESGYLEAIDEFKAQGDKRGAGGVLVKLARMVRDQGEPARTESLLAEAIELLEPETPGPELVLAYTHLARYNHYRCTYEAGLEWAEKAIASAAGLDRDELGVRALQYRGFIRYELGDLGGVDEVKESLRLGLRYGLGEDTAAAYVNCGDLLWWTEGPAAGLETYQAGIEFAERRGLAWLAIWLKAEAVWTLFDLGRWDEALHLADEIVKADLASYQSLMVLPYLAQIRARRGDLAAAAALRDEFLPRARANEDPQVLVPALATAALVEEQLSGPAAALPFVAEYTAFTEGRQLWRTHQLPQIGRICALAGATSEAERLLARKEARAAARDRYAVQACEAVLAEAQGNAEEALDLYSGVAEAWAAFGVPLEEAFARLGAARCLLALDRANEASESADRARSLFAGLGCRALAAEAASVAEQAVITS